MAETPTLDLTRLKKLKDQRDAAMAASQRTYDDLRELASKRGRIQGDIGNLEWNARQNLIDPRRSIAAETAKLASEFEVVASEIASLNERAEPIRERANALNRLYARCAEFLGDDSHVR